MTSVNLIATHHQRLFSSMPVVKCHTGGRTKWGHGTGWECLYCGVIWCAQILCRWLLALSVLGYLTTVSTHRRAFVLRRGGPAGYQHRSWKGCSLGSQNLHQSLSVGEGEVERDWGGSSSKVVWALQASCLPNCWFRGGRLAWGGLCEGLYAEIDWEWSYCRFVVC